MKLFGFELDRLSDDELVKAAYVHASQAGRHDEYNPEYMRSITDRVNDPNKRVRVIRMFEATCEDDLFTLDAILDAP